MGRGMAGNATSHEVLGVSLQCFGPQEWPKRSALERAFFEDRWGISLACGFVVLLATLAAPSGRRFSSIPALGLSRLRPRGRLHLGFLLNMKAAEFELPGLVLILDYVLLKIFLVPGGGRIPSRKRPPPSGRGPRTRTTPRQRPPYSGGCRASALRPLGRCRFSVLSSPDRRVDCVQARPCAD